MVHFLVIFAVIGELVLFDRLFRLAGNRVEKNHLVRMLVDWINVEHLLDCKFAPDSDLILGHSFFLQIKVPSAGLLNTAIIVVGLLTIRKMLVSCGSQQSNRHEILHLLDILHAVGLVV